MSDVRALACVIAVLIATDALLMNQNMWVTVPIASLSCILLVAIARHAGLSLDQLGLGRAHVVAGIRWGLSAALIVAVGYGLFAVMPFGRSVLDDDSMPTTAVQAAVKVLVVIPLRTIVLEELAFRGVLWGFLNRRWGAQKATAWSAAAFGLWHIPAGLRLINTNEALDSAAESTVASIGIVVAIVAFTALAGALFAELRRRSGSLVAPAGLHWATNSFGTILSAVK